MADFNLHNLVTVRLVDAGPGDVEAMKLRLGQPADGGASPDLVIRFVERLTLPVDACGLGGGAAFGAGGFYLLKRGPGRGVEALLPLDLAGRGAEVVVERGSEPPLLAELFGLGALARGGLALPASTFEFEGRGCAVAGWPHGGKTAALIGMTAAGARFVADDVTFLQADGRTVFGLPGPIEVRERYLTDSPKLAVQIDSGERRRMAALRSAAVVADVLRMISRSVPVARRFAARVVHAVEERRKVRVAPTELFRAGACLPVAALDCLVISLACGEAEASIRRITLGEGVGQLGGMMEHERARISAYYAQFRSAFPERRNPLLEQAGTLEEKRLREALEGKPIYLLRHPRGAQPAALAEALISALRQGTPAVEPVVGGKPGGLMAVAAGAGQGS